MDNSKPYVYSDDYKLGRVLKPSKRKNKLAEERTEVKGEEPVCKKGEDKLLVKK